MLAGILALAMVAQATTATIGPALSPVPRTAAIARSGDATVLGAIGAADANEIEAATLATTKGGTDEVRAYAAMLLKVHQVSLTSGTNLAKQLKITRLLPNDSAMARAHVVEMAELNGFSGDAFDKAFVQRMVGNHKAGIVTVRETLLPQARRAQVKAFVRQRLPTLLAHQLEGEKWLAAHP